MQRILCVCVRDDKFWNIEPNDTKNIYFLIRKVFKIKPNEIKSLFNLFLSQMWHLRFFYFLFFLHRIEICERWWIKKQRVLCVCVRDEKSWNIESNDTKNIYFLIR